MQRIIQLAKNQHISENLRMLKLTLHQQQSKIIKLKETQKTDHIKSIAHQLYACAAKAGNSQQKRLWFIRLPQIIAELATSIVEETYRPQPFTVFAVTDPKLREIFAPAFADRLVQQWLISHIEPWWDKRFIDDNYANRKGKGTQAAIDRLQHLMRQPKHRWYCQMDIRAFFPSIDRKITYQLWQAALPKLPYPIITKQRLNQVATAILQQNPNNPPAQPSGQRALLAQIPPHKSLFHTKAEKGMPIGSLSSQFFANVYMNELDQYIKHQLKINGYVRYVDDFVILGSDPQTLIIQKQKIETFLAQRLALEIHPNKIILQRCNQGTNFLGAIIYPHHRLTRQRSVRALRRRIAWFKWLIFPHTQPHMPMPSMGTWQRWLQDHQANIADGIPSPALLQRMLATLNSYYGIFSHANTYRLRKHIYHKELGVLQKFFLPADANYQHLKIKKAWIL